MRPQGSPSGSPSFPIQRTGWYRAGGGLAVSPEESS